MPATFLGPETLRYTVNFDMLLVPRPLLGQRVVTGQG
jgi:hypothetical protein